MSLQILPPPPTKNSLSEHLNSECTSTCALSPWQVAAHIHLEPLERPIQSPGKIGQSLGHKTGGHDQEARDRHRARGCTLVWNCDGCTGWNGKPGMRVQQGNHEMTADLQDHHYTKLTVVCACVRACVRACVCPSGKYHRKPFDPCQKTCFHGISEL